MGVGQVRAAPTGDGAHLEWSLSCIELKNFFSPATIIATFALAVALGGTGFAAAQLSGANRVAPGQATLGSGATMIGYFTAGGSDGTSGYIGEGITFPKRLPSGFNQNHVKYLTSGASYTTRCPGPGHAARGWMCFYEGQRNGVDLCCIYNQHYDDPAVAPYGVRIYWNVNATSSYVDGQWVVRAP
jgi:hypothetical protein